MGCDIPKETVLTCLSRWLGRQVRDTKGLTICAFIHDQARVSVFWARVERMIDFMVRSEQNHCEESWKRETVRAWDSFGHK